MLLTARDVAGGALHFDVGEDGLLVERFPQHALLLWRALASLDPAIAHKPVVPASEALGALRVALYIGKGVAQCARALNAVAAAPAFCGHDDRDDDVAAFLQDFRSAEAAHVRHELYMHPAPCDEAQFLGPEGTRLICATHGVGEATVLERLARDSGTLRLMTPMQDAAGVVERALTHHAFHTVDILFRPPFDSAAGVLAALSNSARSSVRSVHLHFKQYPGEFAFQPPSGGPCFVPPRTEDAAARAVAACSLLTGLRSLHIAPVNEKSPEGWCPQAFSALAALTALTQLCVQGLPAGFRHPHLQSLGMREVITTGLDLPALRSLRLTLRPLAAPKLAQLTQIRALSIVVFTLNEFAFEYGLLSPLTKLETLRLTIKDCDNFMVGAHELFDLPAALSSFTRLKALYVSMGGRCVKGGTCPLLKGVCTVAAELPRLHVLRLPSPTVIITEGRMRTAKSFKGTAAMLQSLAGRVDLALVRECVRPRDSTNPTWDFVSDMFGLPSGVRELEAYDEPASQFAADIDDVFWRGDNGGAET